MIQCIAKETLCESEEQATYL